MRTTLTALIHGESGVGKSWLADTVPAPRLILDAEGRAKYTPSGPKVGWDVRAGGPPRYDGTWQTCIASVPDFDTLQLAYQWLRSGEHDFVSVSLDSLMEAQKRCIDQTAGVNALKFDDWGTVLRKLEGLVRSYRDLTLVPSNKVQVVVFIVGTKNIDGTLHPLLQGQLRDTVPYYIDVVGYYFKQAVVDEVGTTSHTRALLIDQQPGFIAKDNTDRLITAYPGGIIYPHPGEKGVNLSNLFALLDVNQAAPAAIPAAPAAIAPIIPEAVAAATAPVAQEEVPAA